MFDILPTGNYKVSNAFETKKKKKEETELTFLIIPLLHMMSHSDNDFCSRFQENLETIPRGNCCNENKKFIEIEMMPPSFCTNSFELFLKRRCFNAV